MFPLSVDYSRETLFVMMNLDDALRGTVCC
jgi:hypothetical protein